MQTTSILKKAFDRKEFKDYTYLILFFLIASFFIFFVIRPVLSIAISLQKESKDLKEINTVYEKNISKIIMLQSQLEQIRPLAYLIDQAVPPSPKLDVLLADVRAAGVASGVTIESLEARDVSYTSDKKNTIKSVALSMKVKGSYDSGMLFVRRLLNQRRLKNIETLRINNQVKGTGNLGIIELSLTVVGNHY